MQVALDIKLHENQQRIFDSTALNVVVKAGKRFGKSELAVFKMISAAGAKPKGLFWYIAPYYSHAEGIAWQRFKDLVPLKYVKRIQENKLTIELVNGSKIILKGADNQVSLRGPKLDGVVFDEAAYMDEYIWNNIIRGQLAGIGGEPPGFAFFISSPLNPIQVIGKNFRDWYPNFYQEALRKKHNGDAEWDAFHNTIYDNPYLSKTYIDQIKDDSSEDEFNVEYLANESAHSGTLVSEFIYDRHVKDLESAGWLWVRGLDWGISHPTACLWASVNTSLKKVHVDNEFQKSGLVIEESSAIIKQMTGDRKTEWSVIDPSTAKRNSQTGRRDLDEFIRFGIGVVPGDNRDRGYDNMKKFFKKDMITVSPKCRQLINQLKTVQYGQKEGEDLLDCLRYILLRVHDFMLGGNINTEKEEVEQPKRKPGHYNLNDPMFGIKPESSFSWANCES